MLTTIRDTLAVIPGDTRRKVWRAGIIAIVAAGLELASVTAIFPFLTIAMRPEAVNWNDWLVRLRDFLGITETRDFQVFLGVVVLVLVIISNSFQTFSKWYQARLVWEAQTDLSTRLMQNYLDHPYPHFLRHNTANMRAAVLDQAMIVCNQILGAAVILFQSIVVTLAIFASLLYIRPVTSLVVIGVLGGLYALLYVAIRHLIQRTGEALAKANQRRFHVAQEAFGAIKETKFYGIEHKLVQLIRPHTAEYARSTGILGLLGQLPFHVMQIVAFGGLMITFIVLLTGFETLDTVIPTMGFFAFAGFRMLPAFQQGLAAATSVRGTAPVLDMLKSDLESDVQRTVRAEGSRMDLKEAVRLEGVWFRYEGADEPALEDIFMDIKKGRSVAIVGSSGSGKTTSLDIILGLLRPTQGVLTVDGKPVQGEAAIRAWQANVGYVPQDVSLQDASIKENIAFGVPPQEIDLERVQRAARLAHLEDLIEEQLPQGYDTAVGERGVRLSGGQRQRIGIARALYRDPEVIVFDEATSNLDSITETRIAEAIRGLGGTKTVILVAHRLSTIEHCDPIYVLERGRVVAKGSYPELLQKDPHFRALAKAPIKETRPGAQ